MRYFMTLLFVLLAYAVFAQNDPKAKEILDKAAAKFKAYPAAEIDFTLTMENPSENIHEMHEGKAWMKGNLYKLNVKTITTGKISIPICRKYRKSTSKIPMKKKKRC